MPKYTKLLPPDEYEKLTLDEKAAYIADMADLLKPLGEPPAPVEADPQAKPNPQAEPNSQPEPNPQDDEPKTS